MVLAIVNYIELFAGCGGLSLGLHAVGYNLVMANELSPMAAETYAYNFFDEELSSEKKASHTLWLTSNYSFELLTSRLREDPRTFPSLQSDTGYSDLSSTTDICNKLIVGDIRQLNNYLDQNPDQLKRLQTYNNEVDDIDLIAGGPPCQSFSMAGLREQNNQRNTLPLDFANFVQKIHPKFVLLENVSGILRPFTNDDKSKKYYAWYEIAMAFAKINYLPLCLHINAKFVGVAQHRPRFILIGVRNDIFKKLESKLNETEVKLFESSKVFFEKIQNSIDIEYGYLSCIDIHKSENATLFSNSFLSPLFTFPDKHFSVQEAIDDLKFSNPSKGKNIESRYLKNIKTVLNIKKSTTKTINNHEKRNNSLHVQKRFRIYQIITKLSKSVRDEILKFLQDKQEIISSEALKELLLFQYLVDKDQYACFDDSPKFLTYLTELRTKKRTQKALEASLPAPATLSIPDDSCHYDEQELRTFTVREMARIQSFPDSFIFKSKITTGGKMRQFEVPQYTQVGNAVPPLLGAALGEVIKNLHNKIRNI